MRIIFCGTPEFAVPSLRALLANSEFTIEAVVTQPDRPRGRGQRLSPPAVKEVAAETGLRIYQPESMKSDEARNFIAEIRPDAAVIIAYGQIIPRRLLEIPRLGWMNLHASLLPKYRGAAPIAWAVIHGETRTGVTTMQLDPGLDTGPILMQREIEIGADETTPELAKRMSEIGAPLVIETLAKLDRGEITPVTQDAAQASYAPILKKENGRIDWSQTASEIYNGIRGLAPWPGAYTTFRGRLCHIWGKPHGAPAAGPHETGSLVIADAAVQVICGGGTRLQLDAVQLEGRKRVTAREFANGARLGDGERFGA
ncbi:MAG TPA: methionyl-tRNA formyltransferase [Candidatus Acidoferrales bacterium]|jgi:methionyl-tRNA formyltransferase|nr:methionyl-tRNA formyltransferase [Candidatus Acidoferrales bacterium]